MLKPVAESGAQGKQKVLLEKVYAFHPAAITRSPALKKLVSLFSI